MPHKGFFSQGLMVLLSAPATLDELENLLRGRNIVSKHEKSDNWELSGPSILIPFRPEVNGYVTVDLVDRPWPDKLGHPQQEPQLFASWSMGHFGPFAFPGNLERAVRQSWVWPKAKEIVPQHKAFIRLRSSYILGAEKDLLCLPKDYQPLPELKFITEIVKALMKHASALCYFNPNGEVVLGPIEFLKKLEFAESNNLPALENWSNIRLFNLEGNWLMMDSVGMEQLDVPDHEACFPKGAYDTRNVASFLRDAELYVLNNDVIIRDGDTMDGPGNIKWQGKSFKVGIVPPPRRVLRWLPCDGSKPPPNVVG